MVVGIIHSSISNIGSLKNILVKIGCKFILVKIPEDIDRVDALILPGVGSFPMARHFLDNTGLFKKIVDFGMFQKKPILGICLGMHLLMKVSFEHKKTLGLNFFDGYVKKIKPREYEQNIHMGWNNVNYTKNSNLFKKIPQDTDFYFVHSYQVVTADKHVQAQSEYAGFINVAIENKNIFGVQFHPEKSQKYGKQLLVNFLDIANA